MKYWTGLRKEPFVKHDNFLPSQWKQNRHGRTVSKNLWISTLWKQPGDTEPTAKKHRLLRTLKHFQRRRVDEGKKGLKVISGLQWIHTLAAQLWETEREEVIGKTVKNITKFPTGAAPLGLGP